MTSSKHIVTPKSTSPLVKLPDWLKFHVDPHIISPRSPPFLSIKLSHWLRLTVQKQSTVDPCIC